MHYRGLQFTLPLLAILLAACVVPPPAVPSLTVVPSPTVVPSLTVVPSPTPAAVLPRYDLVLWGVTLIDGTGAPPLRDAVVAISAGRIAAVGRAGTPLVPWPASSLASQGQQR